MIYSNHKKLIDAGIRAGDKKMFEEDKIWSRFSHDKVDIGEELARVIRALSKALSLSAPLRALSIGSSDEPQFRLLETAFRGGLYLLDIDNSALDIVRERICRQRTGHVSCIFSDYNKIFLNPGRTQKLLKEKLDSKKVNLVTLHHSLYYSEESDWALIFNNLYKKILAPVSAIHAVLMASKSDCQFTTTWLYNHFAGKFFGCYNDQDLRGFKNSLKGSPVFKNTQIYLSTHHVHFWTDDFAKFMAVIWMILLYPNVHKYTLKQKEEITEFIYTKFWLKKKPLIQAQDHLVVYKGLDFKGLI